MPFLNLDKPRVTLAKWCSVLFFLSLALHVEAPAQQPVAREYQIKAVFVFNFTQFIEWPAEAFSSADSPLVIGIVGPDPFGAFIDQTVQGETLQGHNLIVERYNSVNEIGDCHILFIGFDNKGDVRSALDKVRTKPILTVSDADGFARNGGMIRFYSESGKIRIRINMEAVQDANLVISSKLLRLADIIPAANN